MKSLKILLLTLFLTSLSFGQVIYKSIFDFSVITDTASAATKSTFWTIFYGETLGAYRLNWQELKAGYLTGSDSTAIRTTDELYYLKKINNLSGLTNTTTARTNLGLGSMALVDSNTFKTGTWTGAVTSTGTVSGTIIALSGTDINTAGTLSNVAYNNAWGTPKSGMLFDGVDDKIALQDYTDIQEIQLFVNLESVTSVALGTLGTNLTIDITSGAVTLGSGFLNSTIYVNNIPTSAISTGKNFIAIQFDAVSVSGGLLGYDGTSYGKFDLYLFREFNVQTSTSELTDAYNNRRPDFAVAPYKYVGGSQTELITNIVDRDFSGASNWTNSTFATYDETTDLSVTANAVGQNAYLLVANYSTLTVGKKYRLSFDATLISGAFRFIIQNANQVLGTVVNGKNNIEFVWNGGSNDYLQLLADANPSQADFDNFTLTQIGAVAEYKEFGSFGVVDNSPNRLNGNTSGSPISLSKGQEIEYVDYKGQITGATTLTDITPKGYKLESILFENTTANVVTGGIKVGTTAGGTDVVTAATVGANAEGLMTLAKDFFSTSVDQTLYIDAVTAWNSASINLTFRFRKVR